MAQALGDDEMRRAEAWFAAKFALLGDVLIRDAFKNRPPVDPPRAEPMRPDHVSVKEVARQKGARRQSLADILAFVTAEKDAFREADLVRRSWAAADYGANDKLRNEILSQISDVLREAGISRTRRIAMLDILADNPDLLTFVRARAIFLEEIDQSSLQATIGDLKAQISRLGRSMARAKANGLDADARRLWEERRAAMGQADVLRRQMSTLATSAYRRMVGELVEMTETLGDKSITHRKIAV